MNITLTAPTAKFMNAGGVPLIDAEISGQKGFLVFDSGATQTVLDSRYFDFSGKPAEMYGFDSGIKQYAGGSGEVSEIAAGCLKINDISVAAKDFSAIEQALAPEVPGLKLLGSLGFDVLKTLSVLVDYENSELKFDREDDLNDGHIRVDTSCALPVIPVTVGDKTYPFILDTGSNVAVLSPSLMADIPAEAFGQSDTEGTFMLKSLKIGGSEFSDIVCVTADLRDINGQILYSGGSCEGLIGYQFLGDRRALIRFPEGYMTIEKI